MKKLLLLLVALLTSVSGAWATTSTIYLGSSSTIKTNGTYGGINDQGWRGNVTVAPITLAGCISGSSGYIDAGTYGSTTLTISVPSGLTISSYTIGLKLTGSTTACTAGGDVVLNNINSQTVSGSDINAQSASVAFSSITEDNNKECIIEITDLSVVVDGIAETFTREINAANGTFYSGNEERTWTSGDSKFGNKWLSTNTSPQITFYRGETPGSGSNNIIIDDKFRIHTDTYHISVPDRYRIKGYVITGYTGAGKVYTITPNGQTAKSISTDSDRPTTVYVDGLDATSTTFAVGGSSTGNPWIYITSFRVAVEDLLPITTAALSELENISVYSSAATAAKTAVASLTTISEIEATVNSAVNINVAFANCNTTDPVKYLATTGANITGSNFSTDAAWKLTSYNAETGTFKIYNATHETYLGPLPSTYNTAANATTDASEAGVYTITATTAEAASGAGHVVFHQPSFGSSYECVHYQTANSIAVRWDASAKASHWGAVNVYSLTYNHYKIADAASPSTEGATLVASSTNYYISGTEIEYADPFEGLTPVEALNDKPSDGAISSDVVVDYYYEQDATLPFTTSTITNGELDNPTWYYMQINGLATYASGDKMKVDGSSTGLNYERWCFVGDALYGVQIFAESKGVAYPLNIASMANNDNVQITSTSTNTRWFVSGSIENLTIYQKSGENTFALNQLGGTSGGSGWSWNIGLWSFGSKVELSPASSNMPASWAIESINYIPTQDVWTNMGTIGWPSSAARATLQSAITTFGTTTSYANYSALLSAWNTYKTTTNITTPPAGFYRIKSSANWENPNKYLIGTNSPQSASRAAYDGSAGSSTNSIWYYTGTNLINYGNNGYYLIIDDSNNIGNASSAGSGTSVAFSKAANFNEWGSFNIKINNARCLYTTKKTVSETDYYYTDSGNSVNSTYGYVFNVEEVTSLPVTISAAKYASFRAPVAVTIPSGVKAYRAKSVSGSEIILSSIDDGIIPANTGVILYANVAEATTYNFDITTGGTAESLLTGTTAAISRPANSYVLSKSSEGVVGFYGDGATTIPGFKAYYQGSSVKGYSFRFDDETEVKSLGEVPLISEGEMYDLSGRQIKKPTRGLYLTKGQKVIVQ